MTGEPLSAPRIEGHELVRYLGGGGFADVFLYRALGLKREVAVKVLRSRTITERDLEAFRAEANTMALLKHPFIVTVFDTGVAGDGRPYLTMEHYPNPHYGRVIKDGPLPLGEVFRVGIQVASAVEHAHRFGVIHRDIKPANVLQSEFLTPGLTDFGLARADGSGHGAGMSIPYSPPEILLEDSTGDVASDVYSLGATIWALTVGHSPFSVRGEDSERDLLRRVLNDPPPPITRPDAPAELRHLLDQSLRRNPVERPGSALAMARVLQEIESTMNLPSTRIVLPSTSTPVKAQVGEFTEHAPRVVRPQPERVVAVPSPRSVPPALDGVSARDPEPDDGTRMRRSRIREPGARNTSPAAPPAGVPSSPETSIGRVATIRWALALVAVLVVGVVIAAVAGAGEDGGPAADPQDRSTRPPGPVGLSRPILHVEAGAPGSLQAQLAWRATPENDSDRFAAFVVDEETEERKQLAEVGEDATSATVTVSAPGRTCFIVERSRPGFATTESREVCEVVR